MTEPTPRGIAPPGRYRRSRARLAVPILIALACGFVLLRDFVPSVDSRVEHVLTPQTWSATEACVHAALTGTAPGSRLLRRGRTQAEDDGYRTEGVQIEETDDAGRTRRIDVSCRTSNAGQVIEIRRDLYLDPRTTGLFPAGGNRYRMAMTWISKCRSLPAIG